MKKSFLIVLLMLVGKIVFPQLCNDTLSIGHDTTLCTGQTLTLHADQAYLSYLWNTGSTNNSIVVNSPGSYSCRAKIVDSTNLVVNGDFTFGNLFFSSSYIYGTGGSWGQLSSEGQYVVSTNANLTHTNFSACTDHTTGTGNLMVVNGSSTANQSVWCQGVTTVPSTDYIFSAWFTAVHSTNPAILNFSINGTSIGPNANVSSTTCYWQNFFQTWTSGPAQYTANICITNQNVSNDGNDFAIDDIYFARICEFKDTVEVKYNNYPSVNLGNDTLICQGDTLNLDATADSMSTYLWHNNANIANFQGFNSDTIWVEIANGNCRSSDTLILEAAAVPQVDLGNDTLICNGSNLLLDAGNPGANYLWQDNSTNSQLNAGQSGNYWVKVYTDTACTDADTLSIQIGNNPVPVMDPQQAFCQGDSLRLSAGTFNQYLWTNGSSRSYIWVKPTNVASYGIVVWDAAGCFDSTSTEVHPIDMPQLDIMATDDTICFGNTLLINAFGGQSYEWNDGHIGDSWQLIPSQPDTYSVTATNSLLQVNCSADTSIYVFAYDCNTIYVPSAFSPNGDGLNDQFGPVGLFNLHYYALYVYNRWGDLVFFTTDVNQHWDGRDDSGEYLPNNVYTYLIKLKEPLKEEFQMYGTVQLLR